MTTPFPFTQGQVLTAAQMNAITTLPINDQTASYVALVGDVGKRIVMNVASANTVTINNSVFATGDTIFIANKGAGATTVTPGAGVTINTAASLVIAQHGGGTLVATSASVFTFFPSGVSGTLDVEFLLVGGGGGGGIGGGGGGGFVTGSGIIGKDTYTVKVGAGGAGGSGPRNGTASGFISSANGGGAGGSDGTQRQGLNGASGGGGVDNFNGGVGVSGEGNAGGNGQNNNAAGAGGGGSSAVGVNVSVSNTGTNGGAGTSNNYNGSATTYSQGGGGYGSSASGTPTGAGGANTGRGGGGNTLSNGFAGGSGKVIVRYLTAAATGFTITATGATSGTPTVDGLNSYFDFTSTGTLVVA